MSDDVGQDDSVLAQVLAELKAARADREEMAAEIERLKGNMVAQPVTVAQPSNPRTPDAHGLMHLDPETDEYFDPTARAYMWRPDCIDTCACGRHQWARVFTVVGARDIRDAQRPKMAGNVCIMQPHRFVDSLPKELELTDEKREHAQACALTHGRAASEEVRERLRQALNDGVEVEPMPKADHHSQLDKAAQAHADAVGVKL